ncbi:glycosyltransferase family 4 protein [Hydrogenophaga sp.]|uniref:glycosyltransferase family 4 protein n=1 Tax=Hydrogenophaga sp. TaxID=1904254 RepID=UPI003F70139C
MHALPLCNAPRRRLRVLTWHVHGNYLYNLTQVPHDFWLATDPARMVHRTGCSGTLPWGSNVHEAPLHQLAQMEFDVVLYQCRDNWEVDRLRWLSSAQRKLPRIVLEHDPPQQHPTDTPHWCNDPGALLVHVTAFNALMWDNGPMTVRLVEHGVLPLASRPWTGEIPEGLVVVNNMWRRGRRLGLDLWQQASTQVPLCLVGMGSEVLGGVGNVSQQELPLVMSQHRFFFHPVRHTSLGLAVIEAMHAGIPVVGLATTELVTVIQSGHSGYVDTRLDRLVDVMHCLLRDRRMAAEWGEAGKKIAQERFSIHRFVKDWLGVLNEVTAA